MLCARMFPNSKAKSTFENLGRDEPLKLPSEIRYHQEVCLQYTPFFFFSFLFLCSIVVCFCMLPPLQMRNDRSSLTRQCIPPTRTLAYGEYSERVLASFSGKSVEQTLMPQ
jgi:hypothetical protein